MYYFYVKNEYVPTSFSPARTDLALKLLRHPQLRLQETLEVLKYMKSESLVWQGHVRKLDGHCVEVD
jgi:hypothetical protein